MRERWDKPFGSTPPRLGLKTGQGRQESNPQPTVLETVALPIELRPYALLSEQQFTGFRDEVDGFGNVGRTSSTRDAPDRCADSSRLCNSARGTRYIPS